MAPAMDRTWNKSARGLLVGLSMTLIALDLGCAKLGWQRRDEYPPAQLGMLRGTNDIYANRKNPAPGNVEPMALGNEFETPVMTQMPEPDAVERPKTPTASMGVPNASLLLASAERRETSPDPARLVGEARTALESMANYQVVMHRQERVNGTLQPEEDLILAIRRDPKSVRLTWPVGPHKGREVLYRADEPGGMLHVNMADSALPIPRLSIAPDSPMVMRNSRHPVTEAGFDSLIVGLEDALKSSGASALKYDGLQIPAGLEQPHHCLIRTLPSGEVDRVYLDSKSHLPAVFSAESSTGELLERYVFRDVNANLPELASAAAFDPNARWGPPRGLFGRVARGNAAEPDNRDTLSPR